MFFLFEVQINKRIPTEYYFGFGYVIPLLVVGITMSATGLEGYGTDD